MLYSNFTKLIILFFKITGQTLGINDVVRTNFIHFVHAPTVVSIIYIIHPLKDIATVSKKDDYIYSLIQKSWHLIIEGCILRILPFNILSIAFVKFEFYFIK